MEKMIRCTACSRTFKIEGDGRMGEVSRQATCCYCQEPNDVMWPADGRYSVKAVPEHMEERLDLRAIIEAQEKSETSAKL